MHEMNTHVRSGIWTLLDKHAHMKSHRKISVGSQPVTHFKCQKKKCPIFWLSNALLIRKRVVGLSKYGSNLSAWKTKKWLIKECQQVDPSAEIFMDSYPTLKQASWSRGHVRCKVVHCCNKVPNSMTALRGQLLTATSQKHRNYMYTSNLALSIEVISMRIPYCRKANDN